MLRGILRCVTVASDVTRMSQIRNTSRVTFDDKYGIGETNVSD